MTRKQALGHSRSVLTESNIEDALLESELLLRHALKIGRVQLYLELDRELSPEQKETFWYLLRRRLNGEPIAYITGCREFYGLGFYVDPRVFIPRPESELLVERALNLAQNYPIATIAEIGTGCGAIAICLALNLPQAKIYAIDVSADALDVALYNCQEHGVANRICLLHGDMLSPLPRSVDLIVANLPYVRESELLQGSSEPLLALNGGPDGLARMHQLCHELGGKLCPQGHLVLEIGQGQARAVTSLLRSHIPHAKVEIAADLGGIERVLSLTAAALAEAGLVNSLTAETKPNSL